MAKLLVSNSLSLDGVFEAPAKIPGEKFVFAGWSEPYQSQEQNDYLAAGMAGGGVLLFGRLTYEHMKTGWSKQTGPVADFMNNATKYVASRSMKRATWNNTTLIKGDVAEAVARLKQESDQGIAVLGSGNLCRTLRKAGLIDEYSLLIFPLVLGKGKKFFTGGRTGLKLKESKAFSSGVVLNVYVPDRK